jgi:excisionase family DNA binding protein
MTEILKIDQLESLTGWSKSHIYKLTSAGLIPYYKPFGKTIFFKKSEIEEWLLQNRQKPAFEIENEANDYLLTKKRVQI